VLTVRKFQVATSSFGTLEGSLALIRRILGRILNYELLKAFKETCVRLKALGSSC
ncbi:hypothetical protein GIB67_013207, partial [Kingdonia uniflora]